MSDGKIIQIKRKPKTPPNDGAKRVAQVLTEMAELETTTEILAVVRTPDGYSSIGTDFSNAQELLGVLEMIKYECLRNMTF